MQTLMTIEPFGLAKIESISHGTRILDARFNYSVQEAHLTLEKLGEPGRQAYVRLLIVDFIYIVAYTCFFLVLLSSIIRYFVPSLSWLRIIINLPMICGACDVLENSITLFQIHAFPGESFLAYKFSNLMTMIKFVAIIPTEAISVVGITAMAITYVFRKLRKS